ncbi:endonuclease/exonuclease/phosphatase family protein [Marivita sp. XM-24bin2]|mgnify:CR=1 FL=1|jgi:hypothetical protein|uniref:endonuclease/exonuclease/phosphatase family protein n=1 Tax=unclassified Marivita TaxID=2632480 RepID=UPI000D7A976E|nr:endonuclease/exonuclease/phosphatase family protein [Marivita sp. XM-24bin2]MCR9109182.1 endonuclease/exonuclease/phosphatase family protein [Paracoccaceae bacterium]PWL34748.1 MAG: endonuclease [Marivita sp. XM-24bin2]
MLCAPAAAGAKDLRVALWHVLISRDGPGLLLRDLLEADRELVTVANAIAEADADIVVLTRFDYDASSITLRAFAELVDNGHRFVLPLNSNSGRPTNLDVDGDGRFGEPEDAQAYGRFPGQEALAVLSRFPLEDQEVRSFNEMLWRDLTGTLILKSDVGFGVQRVSSGGHWLVPVLVPGQPDARKVTLLIGHAGPPVFDGPEDRNGRRNRDELRLWEQIIKDLTGPFAFMSNTNLDPERGEGARDAMALFLANSELQDPLAGQVTAHWDRPGPMRVSYVLPSSGFEILSARVWPVLEGQQHSLITVDLALPDAPLP